MADATVSMSGYSTYDGSCRQPHSSVTHRETSTKVGACGEAGTERTGYLLRGMPLRLWAPDEFLDPVTDCLILEPVTLLNTDTTLDHLTLQEWLQAGHHTCPRTRTPLGSCLCISFNEALRLRIAAWAKRRDINLKALLTAQYANLGVS